MSSIDDLFKKYPDQFGGLDTTDEDEQPSRTDRLFTPWEELPERKSPIDRVLTDFPEQFGITETPEGFDPVAEKEFVPEELSPIDQLFIDHPSAFAPETTEDVVATGLEQQRAFEATTPITARQDFPPVTLTPTGEDKSTFFGQIGAGFADIQAQARELGQRLPTGDKILPATGENPKDPNFFKAVSEENEKGLNIFRMLSRDGKKFKHEDFEYGRLFPTEASLDQVRDEILKRRPNTTKEEMAVLIDPVRSVLARNEKIKRGLEESAWRKKSDDLYSHEDKVAQIFDRLKWIQETFPEGRGATSDVIRGFFEGTLESDINKMIGWGIVSNPKKAAELIDISNSIQDELAADSIDHGKVVNFMKEMTQIIGPMTKTMTRAFLLSGLGTVPLAGGIIVIADWSAVEAGAGFKEGVEQGGDPDDTALNAILTGLINGYVEKLQVGKLSSLMKDRIKNILKKKTVKELKDFAKNFGTQTGQEALQAMITQIGVGTTLAQERITQDTPLDVLSKSIDRFAEEAVTVAPHMLALTVMSTVFGIAGGKIRAKISKENLAEIDEEFLAMDLDNTTVREGWSKFLNQNPSLATKIQEQIATKSKDDEALDQLEVTPETQEILDESELAAQELKEEFRDPRGPSQKRRREGVEAGMSEEIRNLQAIKEDFDTTGRAFTKNEFRDYWNEVTGEKISREEAAIKIKRLKALEDDLLSEPITTEVESAKEIETGIETPSIEEGVDRGIEEPVRIRDVEQDRVTEEVTEEVVEPSPPTSIEEVIPEHEPSTKEELISEKELIDDADKSLPLLFYETSEDKKSIFSTKKKDYIAFGKAQEDIEYYIPKALADKIDVEYVDVVKLNGKTFEGAEGGVFYDRKKNRVTVQILRTAPLEKQTRVLYHEIMGHAGIANVIGRNDKMFKEATRLFNSEEAKDSVDKIRKDYAKFMASAEKEFGPQAAEDIHLSEWLASQMEDYMTNRVEGSIGHRIWQMFRDWLIRHGWSEAKNVEEFMESLTNQMRIVPASEITLDFRIKKRGAAIALSNDAKKGKGKKKPTVSQVTREAKTEVTEVKRQAELKQKIQREFAKRDVKEAIDTGKEAVKEVKEEAKREISEVKRVEAVKRKIEKEKHAVEIVRLRNKINNDLLDKEVKIDTFHRDLLQLANLMLDNAADKNEFKAFLLRIRPQTEKGLLGGKARSVTKLQEMVEKRDLKRAKNDLIKTIKNIPWTEMEVSYKEQIESKIKDLDFAKMTQKTRDRLVQIQEIMKEGILDLPAHITDSVKRLKTTALVDLGATGITDINNQIIEIIHLHKLKRKLFINRKLTNYKEALDKTIVDIEAAQKKVERTEGAVAPDSDPAFDSGWRKFVDRWWRIGAMRPDRIVSSRIVKKEGTILQQVVTGGMNESLDIYLQYLKDRQAEFDAEFGTLQEDGTLNNMSSIYYPSPEKAGKVISEEVTMSSGKKISITPLQRVSIILHLRNSHNVRGMLQDGIVFDTNPNGTIHKLTLQELESIAASAKPLEKRLANFIDKSLNTTGREALESTSKRIQGFEMTVVDNYFPLHRVDTYKNFLLKGSATSLVQQQQKYLENAGGLQERKENAQGTIVVEDALRAYYQAMKLTGTYKGYAENLRTAKQMLHDIGGEVAKDYGIQKEVRALDRYIKDIEGSAIQVQTDVVRSQKALLGRGASVALGNNPVVVARQFGSYPIIATQIAAKYMIKGMTLGIKSENAKLIDRKLKEFSPQLYWRMTTGTVNAELGDRASLNEAANFFGRKKNFIGFKKDLFETQTALIETADSAVMRRIGWAVKAKVEAETNLQGDAKWRAIAKETDRIVQTTQPIYSREHRSELGRSKEIHVRLIIAFSSVTNQIYNTWGTSMDRFKNNPDRQAAAKQLANDMLWLMVASTATMMVIDELRDRIFFARKTGALTQLSRAAKYAFAPFYLSGYATGAFTDILRLVETGRWAAYDSQMANSNLLTSIGTQAITGLGDVIQAIDFQEWSEWDIDRLGRGFLRMANAFGTLVGGVAVRNIVNYWVRPFFVDRNKPAIINESRKVNYRPNIPRTKTFGRVKYRIRNAYYDDYVREIHRIAQDIFEREVGYESLSDTQKKEVMKDIYRIAVQMAGGFNMSQLKKVE